MTRGQRLMTRGNEKVSIESNTHSFVVRIWLEDPPDEYQEGHWRGHITHVHSGERRYLDDLNDILAYIAPYLKTWGVKL